MPNDTPPDPRPVDPQEEVAKRYKPSITLFAVVYVLTFGVYWLLRGPIPVGQSHASLLAGAVISSVGATGFIAAYLRFMRKLTWAQALAYAVTVVGAMFCADIARIFLLYR